MKRTIILCSLVLLLVLTVGLSFGFQTSLTITQYTIRDEQIPQALDDYVIVQLSDFHNAAFGSHQEEIISAIASCSPDLILLTGDMINKDDTSFDNTKELLAGIYQLAPIYSVAGNHEYINYGLYIELMEYYRSLGITELCDSGASLEANGVTLQLYGINQEHYHELYRNDTSELALPAVAEGDVGILLYHFANQYDVLRTVNTDYLLTFSGHTHGGIIRLPLIGGLVSNDKTFFPEYDGGVYPLDSKYLISSRGLGEAFLPRFNNNPEIVCITLKH